MDIISLGAAKTYTNQRAQELELRLAQVNKELKDYQRTLAQMNPNQEPKQTVSDYETVSLPPNAAEGQINVTAKGLTATNLVQNGDFRNGTSGWSAGGSPLSADNGVLRITATGTTDSPYVSCDLFTKRRGQKLYVRVKAKVTNSECQYIRLMVGLHSVYQYAPEANKEYLISGVLTMPIADGDIWYVVYHGYENAEVATGKVMEIREAMTVDLTAMFGAGNEPTKEECDKMFSHYIDGTKSTISAFRIRSVSEDESQESVVYVLAKDDEGNIEELRSLPNGVKDEINVTQGKATIRTGKLIIGNIGFDNATSYDDNYYRAHKTGILQGLNMVYQSKNSGIGYCTDGNFRILSNASPTVEVGRGMALYEDGRLYVFVEKSKIDAMSGTTLVDKFNSYFAQYPVTLIYRLAQEQVISVQISGTLVGFPSGTVYWEQIAPDAGVYTDKMEVLHKDLPIKSIEKLSKVDFYTGVETELDISEAVIAEDKLSFTHPDLSEGDIVFFEYEYDLESTQGETEIEYYDSRYVIKDSVTDKFYKWNIVVANGQPSIELVEV